jgi:hypothetical protein
MVDCIHQHVLKLNKKALGFVGYVAFTTNEMTNVDNQSWVLIH